MSKNNLEIEPAKPQRSPVIASLLSFFLLGGAGQIYLGQTKKGILLIVLTLVGSLFLIGLIVFPIGAIDAYLLAKRLENGETLGEWEFFWNKSGSQKTVQAPSKWQVVSVALTDKTEEFTGEDRRVIDNSQSDISVTRRFTVTREWSQSYTIEHEKTQTKTKGVNIKIIEPLSIQYSVAIALRDKYTITEGTKKTYTEDVTLQIPANKKVYVLIHWKNIWQNGIATLRDQQNVEIEVPFQVLDGVNFDQSQIDAD